MKQLFSQLFNMILTSVSRKNTCGFIIEAHHKKENVVNNLNCRHVLAKMRVLIEVEEGKYESFIAYTHHRRHHH